jgi:hypothetical protein
MSIIWKTENGKTGKWDTATEQWVSLPLEGKVSSVSIDRNDIVMLFANAGKISELDLWLTTSKTVQAYFATEKITANYAGLTVMITMVDLAMSEGHVSAPIGNKLKSILEEARKGVRQ